MYQDGYVNGSNYATNTDSKTLVAAPTNGDRVYLTDIIIANTSATATRITMTNGDSNFTLPCPVGGAVINLSKPLIGDPDTAWTFAAAASASTIYVTVTGFRGKH